MPDRSKVHPRDLNRLAHRIIIQEATGQVPKYDPREDTPADAARNPHAVALGRLGGLKGAAALTAHKRSRIAAKTAAKRRENKK